MKKFFVMAAIVGMASVAGAVANGKVGFIDLQKAVQATAQGKKAKDSMDEEFKKRKDGLDKKKASIEKMGQELEKKRSVLSEEVLGRRQAELQEEMMKFQKVVAENQMELQKKEKDLLEPIIEKMRKVIERVANEKAFTMIIERQGQNVLFAQKDLDLTEEVIKAFEKDK